MRHVAHGGSVVGAAYGLECCESARLLGKPGLRVTGHLGQREARGSRTLDGQLARSRRMVVRCTLKALAMFSSETPLVIIPRYGLSAPGIASGDVP